MSNLPGLQLENIFLVIISFALILFINKKTNSESALLLVAILTFHHVVAYLYAFVLSLPQNEVDPIGFLNLASKCTNFGYCGYLGQYLYAHYLSKVLALGSSIYFVFLLNVLFFVISLYFFIKTAELFFGKEYRKSFIFLYGLWPSVIFFTTLNYREPFELYLLVIATYLALTGSRSDNFVGMFVSMLLLLLMGMFHIKGLIYLAPVLFIILVSYHFSFSFRSVFKRVLILSIMTVPVFLSQEMYQDYMSEVSRSKHAKQVENKESVNAIDSLNTDKKILSKEEILFKERENIFYLEKNYPKTKTSLFDDFMRKVTFYRASLFFVKPPRTAFYSEIDDKNLPRFIATYSLVYLEYLFSPFIFQVNSLLSIFAYLESILRMILFASALILLRRRPDISVLFVLYLAITGMWALGVVSYGAAIRHHVQTNWILVLLGVPVISGYLKGIEFKYKKS